ncbi:hypothetical protein F5051DRAFT_430114 [Lentinula edodes]|nr:hypothetical protein F5051DRAFT_430114 [Lentinula edodes]
MNTFPSRLSNPTPQVLHELWDLDLGNVKAIPYIEVHTASLLPPPPLESFLSLVVVPIAPFELQLAPSTLQHKSLIPNLPLRPILTQVLSSYATLPISTPFGNASQPNLIQIFNTVFIENGIDDAATAVLTIAPNGAVALISAGTTGAPTQGAFGNVDFKMYNLLTFAILQALTMDISYANVSFYGCGFSSFQDTWCTGKNANLFGFGTAWFQNVILAVRGCRGGTAAWKGTNSSLTECWEAFDSARLTIINTTLCGIQLYWYIPPDDLHSLKMFSGTQDPAETPQVVYP